MKKQTYSQVAEMKKTRKVWLINPNTRVSPVKGKKIYNRQKFKCLTNDW